MLNPKALSENSSLKTHGPGVTEVEKSLERDGSLKRLLIDLALASFDLFASDDEVSYARLRVAKASTVEPVNSRSFRRSLARLSKENFGSLPSENVADEIVRTVDFEALENGPEIKVFKRYGFFGDSIYVDLCRDEYVCIAPTGVTIVTEVPVFFCRPRGMRPLPIPDATGEINALWNLFGLQDEEAKALLAAAIIGFMNPRIHSAALVLEGPQGCGKTTLSRLIKQLVDPEAHEVRAFPGNEKDVAILCQGRWLVVFDNLSGLLPWAQDALCRVITGGTLSFRELYTSDGEVNLAVHNPVILNGIDDIATRPDLAERSVIVSLPQICSDDRLQENELWTEFENEKAKITGAFYKAIASALRNQGGCKLASPPRMADFANFVTAAEPALGLTPGAFMKHYESAMNSATAANFEGIPAIGLLADLILGQFEKKIEDTSSGILMVLNREVADKKLDHLRSHASWPKSAQILSNQIKRGVPLLNARGIHVVNKRTPRERLWCLWGLDEELSSSSSSS